MGPRTTKMETTRHILRVDRREINYLSLIVASYDGMALVRTIDPHEALIELQISPGCEHFVFELLDHLVEDEAISLSP